MPGASSWMWNRSSLAPRLRWSRSSMRFAPVGRGKARGAVSKKKRPRPLPAGPLLAEAAAFSARDQGTTRRGRAAQWSRRFGKARPSGDYGDGDPNRQIGVAVWLFTLGERQFPAKST